MMLPNPLYTEYFNYGKALSLSMVGETITQSNIFDYRTVLLFQGIHL